MISAETLSAAEIRRRLRASVVGRQLYLFGEVESTNAALRGLAREGAIEGSVVLAESQTAGRGRQGQAWFSPSGVNLYASVLFRPSFRLAEAPRFACVASLAVADAVKDLGLSPAIKWPNDVLVDRKKVAGSLVECASREDEIDFLILGVGVNLNASPEALRAALGAAGVGATSLAAARGGREVDRNAFAASYLGHLDAWVARYRTAGPGPIVAAWRERDILTGRRVEVRGKVVAFQGRAAGIDEHGALVVEDSLGRRHTVVSEEVRIVE